MKTPISAFYGGSKQATTKLSFYFCTWIWSLGIQLQEGSPTFDKVGWVGIIAIKTERTQIHFLSDILIVVASLDLKVPISSKLPVPLAPTRVQIFLSYTKI